MSRPQYGSALVDGKVRYFSPSALTTGDPEGSDGCPRAYWFTYVAKLRRPPTRAQELGTALHAEIESYLKTGVKNLGSLALSGLHMLPTPGPDLLIEHDIAGGSLETAPLRVRGIPIMGYIDLVHARGTNAGVQDVEDTIDPEGTVEVFDHKTTSDVKYIKTPAEMSRTIQMTTYGKWVITVAPQTPQVRLSHGYFVTKGRHTPRKVTLRVLPETIEKQWEHVERVASVLIDAAAETNPDLVPANTRACGSYGGCFHKSYCKAAMHNSLAGFIGDAAAASFFKSPATQTPGVPDMASPLTLINRLNAAKNANPPVVATATEIAAATPVNGTVVTATGNLNPFAVAAAPAASMIDPAVEMARLARQEITTKYPGLEAALAAMTDCDIGVPGLSGEAARAVAMLSGTNAVAIPGFGEMGQYTLDSVEQILAAPAQMQEIVKSRATTTVVVPTISNALLSPETPPATVSAPPIIAPAAVIEEAPKKGRGRPKKVVAEIATNSVATTMAPVTPAMLETPPQPAPATGDVAVLLTDETAKVLTVANPAASVPVALVEDTPGSDAIYFYVDAIPSCRHEDFWALVDHFVAEMNAASGADDFRNADPKTTRGAPFCFGGYKGCLATMLRATPIAGGHYVLDNASSEIASVVIDTMRPIVAASGGFMVKGTR